MKKSFLLIFLLPIALLSQSQDWVKIATDEVGLDARGYRVWVADVNGDDYPDLLWGGDAGAVRNHIHLYLNTQNPNSENPTDRIFVDASESSGIQSSRIDGNENRITDVAALGDVDNDGDLDLVTSIYTHRLQDYTNFERTDYDTTYVNGEMVIKDSTYMVIRDPGDRTELLLNDGNGNFTIFEDSGLNTLEFDTGIEAGLTNVSSISFLDYNRDGNLDIYFGTWFTNYVGSSADRFMPNILVKGNGDGTFERVGALGTAEPLYGATVFDWNNDGWVDIATSSYCRTASKLYMNMGGEFVDATILSNYNTQRLGGDHGQNLCQWEALPGDFDNDGDLDLLEVKVHGGYNDGEGRTTVTVNGGEDEDYTLNWDLSKISRDVNPNSHIGDMGGVWMDWDNDGDLDMMIGQDGYLTGNPPGGVRLFFLIQNEEGRFIEVTESLGILPEMLESHSMEPADFDLDGDLDLFVASTHRDTTIVDGEQKIESYKRIELLENTIGNKKYWVAIKPKLDDGMVYNGTRIEVYQGDEILTREIHQGGGHFGYQQPETQYFGLGETAKIDSVKIKFNGDTDEIAKFGSLTANKSYLLGTSDFIEEQTTNYESDNGVLDLNGVVTLGEQDVNTKETKTVSILNNSDEAFSISGIKLEGETEIRLITESLDVTIGAGESFDLVFEFEPSERKEYKSQLMLTTNAANGIAGKYLVEVIAKGFEEKPIATANTDEIEFDATFVDDENKQVLVVSNTGELPLTITNIDIEDNENFLVDFEKEITVESGATQNFEITFKPTILGEFNSMVSISSNGHNSQNIEVVLFGVCDGPLPNPELVSSPIVNFGEVEIGASKMNELEVSNTGNGDFIITEFKQTIEESPFEIKVAEMPVVIEPNQSKIIDVEFSPTNEDLIFSSVSLEANFENSINILLRGNGKITSVERLSDGSEVELSAQPNPITASSIFEVSLNGKSNMVMDFFIVDLNGKVILKSPAQQIFEGSNRLNFKAEQLSSGAYYLVGHTGIGNIQMKLIVE